MNTLDHYKETFNSVGWFIPPYVTMGFLSFLAKEIRDSQGVFDQKKLQAALSLIYSKSNLAAMVVSRYPITPHVSEFAQTIAEAVESHFMGLDHVAVCGLLPVIEGVALKLAEDRSVKNKLRNTSFKSLAEHCKQEVKEKKIGAVGEVVSMIDSFIVYSESHLYVDSSKYPLSDNTNRHGILHGSYSDMDYGKPINFYKAISAIDFLCFISAIRASISWFAPSQNDVSERLATYYHACANFKNLRPARS
jgi:hypothetical protein